MKLPNHLSANEPQVEMIPLIDVVFLVLVAFIYASMFMTYKSGLPVDLPKASETKQVKSEVLTLTIKKNGLLFLEEKPITLVHLGDALAMAKTNATKDIALYVVADREAKLESLVNVMDLARKAGISGLTIAADKDFNSTTIE
ncbi:MAG TPA: biopolymer transporter ExbD [Cycloclasticus sp.]|jgi:biopolymer transport protein ExbD|nr:biopolymer transporter ExbD [Cycloclasticus sp.]